MILEAVAKVRDYRLLVVRRPETTSVEVRRLRTMLSGVEVQDFAASPYHLGGVGPLGRFAEARADNDNRDPTRPFARSPRDN